MGVDNSGMGDGPSTFVDRAGLSWAFVVPSKSSESIVPPILGHN